MILKNGYILDGNNNLVKRDLKIEDKKIVAIEENIDCLDYIDVTNLLITPGFIDVHVHTRNPGQEYKERVDTVVAAALCGGFTTICPMPNTTPILDTPQSLDVANKLYENHPLDVYHYGALSKNLVSSQPADYKQMKASGAIAFSNDGRGVQLESAIKEMMIKLKEIDMMYVSHSEVDCLVNNGVIHAGKQGKILNLPGISSSVESIAVAKEIILAHELDVNYHVCHLSSGVSVELIRMFKGLGAKVSGEVTPHHLLLTEEDILLDDPNFKMNPPLRTKEDQQRLIDGLNDKTIEIIATDHAPHSPEDKGESFIGSAFGIVGLETCFNLLYTYLVKTQKVPLQTIIDCLTINPAKRFNIEGGVIEVGATANLAIIDLNTSGKINVTEFASFGKNSPFNNVEISSIIKKTIYQGEIVYEQS